MSAWYARQERAVQVLLIALVVMLPALVGVLITERQTVLVHSLIECAPVPTDRLGKCPPDSDRPVLTLIIPADPNNRRDKPFWRVMSWDPQHGWWALAGMSTYRVHDWHELPEVEQ